MSDETNAPSLNPTLPLGDDEIIDVPVANGANGQIQSRFAVWYTLRFKTATLAWSLNFACAPGASYVLINDTTAIGTISARTNSLTPITLDPGEVATVVVALDLTSGRMEFRKTNSGGSGSVTFAAVKNALASATSAVGFNGQNVDHVGTLKFVTDIRFQTDTNVYLQNSLTPGAPAMSFVGTTDSQILEVWSNPAGATSTVDPFVVYAKNAGNLGVIFDVAAPGFIESGGISFAAGIRGSGFPTGGGDGNIVEPNLGTMTFTSGVQSDGNFNFVTLPVGTAGKHPQTTWHNGSAGIQYFEIVPDVNVTYARAAHGQLYLSAYGGTGNDFVQLDCTSQPIFIGGSASAVSLRPGGTDVFKVTAAAIGFFNTTPAAKQSIAGSLSTVVDPNAKAVLTSILLAFTNYGFAANTTT